MFPGFEGQCRKMFHDLIITVSSWGKNLKEKLRK